MYIDTKTIMGGGRHELGPDDYILAVVEEPYSYNRIQSLCTFCCNRDCTTILYNNHMNMHIKSYTSISYKSFCTYSIFLVGQTNPNILLE